MFIKVKRPDKKNKKTGHLIDITKRANCQNLIYKLNSN